jgi:hypothetical protein
MFNYLDLPPLPNYLERHIMSLVTESINDSIDDLNIKASAAVLEEVKKFTYNKDDSLGYPLSEAKGSIARFDFLNVDDEISTWVHTNIGTFAYISIQYMHGGKNIPPHVDEIRSNAYNYIIETGNATTSFYQPKKEFDHLRVYPHTTFDLDKLELIEQIKIQPRRWHEINTSMIHGVDNLDYSRVSLSLSIINVK